MTAIEHYNGNGAVEVVPNESLSSVVETYGRIIGQVANTDFVPRAFKGKPEAILACFLYGREIGLQPMQSLRMIDSIQGTPTLKPEAMRALVRQAGHRIWFDRDDYSATSVTIHGQRREDPADMVMSATFTWEDGKRAKLTEKDTWKQYPRAMLSARATSELCRLHFADVIGGLSYTPDEAEEFGAAPVAQMRPARAAEPVLKADEDGVVIEQAALPPAAAEKPTTRRRRPPNAPPVPEGHVSSGEGKTRLIAAYEGTGLDHQQATSCASVLWQAHNLSSEPVPAEKLERMIADVAADSAAHDTTAEEPGRDGFVNDADRF